MEKTNKKFPIFFIIFTLAYISLEIVFRVDMLNVVSTLKDIVEIESIEVVGRFIASIGFVVFLFSNFKFKIKSLKKWNILVKIIVYPVLMFFAFKGFYNFQEKVIDHFAKNFTIEDKKEALLLSLEKESLYFDKINQKGYPYNSKNKEESNSKIFLALYPFLSSNDKEKIDYLEKNKKVLVANSVLGKWEISENIKEMAFQESEILKSIFFGYRNMDENKTRGAFTSSTNLSYAYNYILANYEHAYRRASMNYKSKEKEYRNIAKRMYYAHKNLITKKEFYSKVEKDFAHAVISFLSGNKKNQYSKANNIEYILNSNFYMKGHEVNYEVSASTYKHADMRMFILAQNYQSTLIFSDLVNSMEIDNKNCSASNEEDYSITLNNKNVGIVELNKEKFNKAYYEIFNNSNKNYNSINCNISYNDYVETKSKLHELLTVKNASFYIDNIPLTSVTPSYVNNHYLFRKIAMNLFEDFFYKNKDSFILDYFNYDFEKYERFEKSLNYSSEKAFISSIKAFFAEEYTKKYLEKAKENGLNLSFLRNIKDYRVSYEEFYNIKKVKKEIERVFPFFINSKGKVINSYNKETMDSKNIEDFKEYLIKKNFSKYLEILNNQSLMEYGQKYYDFGNAIAKSFIAPPLVLTISAVMIFLSLINLIFKIVNYFYSNNKKLLIIKPLLLIIGLTLPVLMENNYSNNAYLEKYKVKDNYKYNMLIWLQNTEKVVELLYIDNYIMKDVYNIIYKISLEYETKLNGKNKYLEIKKEKLEIKLDI